MCSPFEYQEKVRMVAEQGEKRLGHWVRMRFRAIDLGPLETKKLHL